MMLTDPFDHAALLRFLDELQERFPFCERLYLGNSILDRPIPMLRVGSGARQVLYVGAHHGMEWITSALLCRFTWDFCEAIEGRRRLCALYPADLCQSYTLYVLPMLNPDGVEYQIHGLCAENPLYERVLEMNGGCTDFSHWQANARGVDLNHNYDAGFAEYKCLEAEAGILQGAPTRYSGECAESEIEVSLLCNFIRFQEQLCGVMTLHTQGEEIFYRSGGITLPKSDVTARRLATLTGYRPSLAEGLASYGGLTDWCVQKLSIPSFTVECGKGCNPLPFEDLSSIYLRIRHALVAFPTLL